MVAGLFKRGWQSDSADKRRQAVEAMDRDNSEHQVILETLARDDPDQSVRSAALHKLNNAELLFQLSIAHPDPVSQAEAESAFARLIGPTGNVQETQLRALYSQFPEMGPAIACYTQYEDFRNEVILSFSPAQQAELIAGVDYADSRQLIAEQLQEEEQLQLARKLLRGKDKNTEKIIRTKLDTIHARQREAQENHQAAELICEKMEYLAAHDLRSETRGQHSIWSQRWQALDFSIDAAVADRYAKAERKLAELLEQQSRSENALAEQKTLAEQLMKSCYQLAKQSSRQLLDGAAESLILLNDATTHWATLKETAEPDQAIELQFKHARDALAGVTTFADNFSDKLAAAAEPDSKILKSAIAAFTWPDQYPELTARSELQATLDQLEKQQAASQQEKVERLDKLHKRINRLLGSTKRGDLPRAKRELAAITKAAARFVGKDRNALDERVTQASEAVAKMSDWVDFATEPKLLELCEQMEGLVGSKLHADKLSAKISELQKQWKSLGHCDSADKHWPRFKQAADKAYEPCAAFFKQRRELRRQNLEKREPLVKRMRELLENTEWDADPDYKQVEAELQRIHNAWQKIKEVEPGAGRKQWNRLVKIRSAIYQNLDVVYDANLELKNQLIEQVNSMLDGEVNEQSLDKLKLYQTRWKQVGVTRRKQDQKAWKKFKNASDAVYQKIQGLRKARRHEQDEKLNAYRRISRAIQNLAKTAKDLATADAEFEQLETDYKALPELPHNLPEKLVKGLAADYRRAGDAYGRARQRMQAAGRQQQIDTLAKKAALCAELEQLGSDPKSGKVDELQQAMADIEIANNSLAKQFALREKAALDPDRSQAAEARRLFCIELEILLGVDSPAEDAQKRMQIQLERMKQQGIGQAQKQTAATIEKRRLEWLCMPGADAKTQLKLDQRFNKLLKPASK